MKRFVAFALIATSVAAFSNEVYVSPVTGQPFKEDGKFTLEQIKARDEKVLKKTGGFLLQKAEGPLALLVDARDKTTLVIDEVARLYKLGTHLDINIAKEPCGKTCPLEFGRAKMAEKKPLFVVVVISQTEKWPALSVFPEERIGLVNADKLKGGKDPTALEMRVTKEIWRAMGFIGGVGFSAQENDMMQAYYTLDELDANNYPYIQPMNMVKMQKMWKRFGVKKESRIPYRIACQQGWAPQPTNAYQKAVWDEVHKLPENPIKIKPEAKKVEK